MRISRIFGHTNEKYFSSSWYFATFKTGFESTVAMITYFFVASFSTHWLSCPICRTPCIRWCTPSDLLIKYVSNIPHAFWNHLGVTASTELLGSYKMSSDIIQEIMLNVCRKNTCRKYFAVGVISIQYSISKRGIITLEGHWDGDIWIGNVLWRTSKYLIANGGKIRSNT